MKILRGILIAFLSLLIILTITGLSFEMLSRRSAHAKYNAGQSFTDVCGYKLHYNVTGKNGPTVVFESGLDFGGSLCWYKVQPEVARFTKTFIYDRAGIFLSERGNLPKTGYQMAVDLHNLLIRSGQKAPFILVGHSMAGIILPNFIRLYPNEVKGIVFVDSSHPLQVKRFADYPELNIKAPAQWQAKLMGDFGLLRLFYNDRYPSIALDDSVNIAAHAFIPEAAAGVIDEANAFNTMADSAALIRNFGNIPLIVLTGTAAKRISDFENPETGKAFMRIWMELQKDHLNRSTQSKQILATRSGHYIQLDQPELVVDAIKSLIK